MAIIYALCCLAVTAVNDFIFKLFARHSESTVQRKSCGMFVTIAGIVEVIFMLFLTHGIQNPSVSIFWGCIGGFLSVTSNILLIESMRFQSAGVSSTIFRLNMVLVVIGGFLFFNEPMTGTLIAGIVCAASAILCFLPGKSADQPQQQTALRAGFALALVACFLRALMSLTYKAAFTYGADLNLVPLITGVFWIFGGIIFMLIREHAILRPDKQELKTGVISGVFIGGIVVLMARMNACGNASIVNPIAQMSFLGTFVLSVVFLKERMSSKKLAAVILGCAAIAFLTYR